MAKTCTDCWAQIVPGTMVSLMPDVAKKTYRERIAHTLFFGVKAPERFAIPMLEILGFGDETITTLGAKVGLAAAPTAIVIGTLAKMGIVLTRRKTRSQRVRPPKTP